MTWWEELKAIASKLSTVERNISNGVIVEDLVDIRGAVKIDAGTRICRGALIQGPAVIGRDCLIGNNSFIRGPAIIGNKVRIGFSTEVKNAIIGDDTWIGPLCFVGDSVLEDSVFLGALVRTSNFRLDRANATVLVDGKSIDSERTHLGAYIQKGASLGIGVIILPGRIIGPGAIIGPRVIVQKNLEPGTYLLKQQLVVSRKINRKASLYEGVRGIFRRFLFFPFFV